MASWWSSELGSLGPRTGFWFWTGWMIPPYLQAFLSRPIEERSS